MGNSRWVDVVFFFSLGFCIFPVYGESGPIIGCVQWSHEFTAAVYAAPAVGPSGLIYVPCEDGSLYFLDPNGVPQGSFPSSGAGAVSTPTVSEDGTLYFGNSTSVFWSLTQDGQINWSKSLDGAIVASPTLADNGMIIVTTLGGTVYAYEPDGTYGWEYAIPHTGQTLQSIMAPAAIGTDGSVYVVGMYSPKLFALDPNSGAERWVSDLTNYFDPDSSDDGRDYHGFDVAPVVSTDGTLYVIPTYSKTLFALDPQDGQVLWQTEMTRSEDTGLVAYWKLDTSHIYTVYDSQGNHNGTLHNMSQYITSGRIGNSFSFDGIDDYIEIPGFKGISGSASRTCSAWIRTSDTTWNDIVGWGQLVTGQRWLLSLSPDGFVTVGVVGGYQQARTAVNDGQWHHVAVVLADDGTATTDDIKIYIDGMKKSDETTVSQTINTAQDATVKIGLFQDNDDRHYSGLIDDVRIYNRALTDEEIKPLAMPEDFLVTRYGDASCWSTPAVGPDGTIYVSFDHPYIFALNPDGSIKWSKRIGMTGGFTLTVDSQNKIYAASEDGTLYVLDSDGNLLSQFDSTGVLASPIVLGDGSLLLSDQKGKLYSLSGQSCGENDGLTWPADLNRDGKVNLNDFVSISQSWLVMNDFFILPENTLRLDRIDFNNIDADIDRDFYVNLRDLTLLFEQWLLDDAL